MLLFPHQRTFSYWFALLCLPFWCLVVGSAALTEIARLFLPPAAWVLVGIVLSNLIALPLCFPLLIRLACFASPSDADASERVITNYETTGPTGPQVASDSAGETSHPGPSVPIWLLDHSWLLEVVLLIGMALAWRFAPPSTPLLTPMLLVLMGLLFCTRGVCSHLAFLWVMGTLTLGTILLTVLLLPPLLWQGGMLTSCTLILWGTFLRGIWLHWDLLRWLCWEYHPQNHHHFPIRHVLARPTKGGNHE